MIDISMRHFARYTEIFSVLLRHGMGAFVAAPGSLPQMIVSQRRGNELQPNQVLIGIHLREAFNELGPTFIKVGQLASTRSDLLPAPIINELAKLQDGAHPFSFGEVRRVVEESLQQRLESVFQEFEYAPLATASISQVHRAVLKNGDQVVVKVRRPYIHETVYTDLEIFETLVTHMEQRTEWGRRFPVRTFFKEFAKTIKEELDFLNEGRNTEKIAGLSRRNRGILFPKIYWEYSSPSVLTMEFIPGVPLSKLIEMHQCECHSQKDAEDFPIIADRLSSELLRQILHDGNFHGDPHPGNILILPSGKIALIDFGMAGTLDTRRRHQLMGLIKAFVRGKDQEALKLIAEMGIVPETIDRLAFGRDFLDLRARHLDSSGKQINLGETIQDFFNLIFRYGIVIPSELVLMGKSLLTLEGVLYSLDPSISLIQQAKPFTRRLLWEKMKQKGRFLLA